MTGYLYIIENIINHKCYVGQTTNIKKREYEHFRRLRKNEHINKKLQNAFNKYGEDSFIFSYKKVEVQNCKELDQLEIDLIKKMDSYFNGYNLTLGGEGGLMPDKRLLDFREFCMIYLGGNKWKGFSSKKISESFHCSRSFIDMVRRGDSYSEYLQKVKELTAEEQVFYIQEFEKRFDIKEDDQFTDIKRHIMSDEERIISLCLLKFVPGSLGELSIKFSCSDHVFERLKNGETYKEVYNTFIKMSDEEQRGLAEHYVKEWNIGETHKRSLEIKKEDVFLCYAAYEKGKTIKDIAIHFGLKYTTVKSWINKSNRKKMYEEYNSLSSEEKQIYLQQVWP